MRPKCSHRSNGLDESLGPSSVLLKMVHHMEYEMSVFSTLIFKPLLGVGVAMQTDVVELRNFRDSIPNLLRILLDISSLLKVTVGRGRIEGSNLEKVLDAIGEARMEMFQGRTRLL